VEKSETGIGRQVEGRNDADVFILQVEQVLKVRDRLLQVADDISDVAKGTSGGHIDMESGK
jgi:hypothetical protein